MGKEIHIKQESQAISRRFFRLLKKTLTGWDLVLIGMLIMLTIASFSLWIKRGEGRRVIVMVDEEVVMDLPLEDKQKEFGFTGCQGPFVIELAGGRVRMKASSCPNKTCIKMGWIKREGQMICCIPNRAYIKITGKKEGYDALAR